MQLASNPCSHFLPLVWAKCSESAVGPAPGEQPASPSGMGSAEYLRGLWEDLPEGHGGPRRACILSVLGSCAVPTISLHLGCESWTCQACYRNLGLRQHLACQGYPGAKQVPQILSPSSFT